VLRCGLLGEKLGHSYSPRIHAQLGDYEYKLYEKSPEELESFLQSGSFDGLNVTIPYKKAVVPYCAELSPEARTLGSVNTLVRRLDGSLYGANTDYFGFLHLVSLSGISPNGKKALVFGSGGASVTVAAVLKSLGAEPVVISRHGPDNYENLDKHKDARIVVNTTPLGMYPNTGAAAADLTLFPHCEAVFDIVYNPARTALLLQAEALGIPCFGGLSMLVAQAKKSSEYFTGKKIPDSEIGRIEKLLRREMLNVVLIGMPGCGKSTVGRELARAMGREFADADEELVKKTGLPIPEFFRRYGEAAFREQETQVLKDLGKRSGLVLATGGGCVTRPENYPLLHQNGVIVWLRRNLSLLPRAGRPVSQAGDLGELYRSRQPLYERFADLAVDNSLPPLRTADAILEAFA
jgi:shikimate dehydrogenase